MARPKSIHKMSIEALVSLRDNVASELSRRASDIRDQLSQVMGKAPALRRGSKLKGRKVEPKYRSKKDPTLTWAGRGATPRWMREEMKARKLDKKAFLIKRS